MALVKCKECGNEVATTAVSCPACGAPQRPRSMSAGKVVALVLGGLALLCFGTCFFGGLVSAVTGNTPKKTASVSARQSARTVDIRTLLGEYENNEVRADSSYKGKFVQVMGVVRDVKRDITNDLYVTMGTGERLEVPVVQCFFDDVHAKKAASLSPGMRVTISGKVDGLMMNVVLRECEFLSL